MSIHPEGFGRVREHCRHFVAFSLVVYTLWVRRMSAAPAEVLRLVHVICVCCVYMLLSITLLPLLGLLRDIVLALYNIVSSLPSLFTWCTYICAYHPHLCSSLLCCPHASLEKIWVSLVPLSFAFYFPFVCLRLSWLPTCYDGLHVTSNCVGCRVELCRPLCRKHRSEKQPRSLVGHRMQRSGAMPPVRRWHS